MPQSSPQKGKTTYNSLGFSFGGNKWLLETSYRRYKGFYELNTGKYDPDFKTTGIYYQNPDMLNASLKAKFLYFFKHHKFSYKAAYSCNYRQYKSAFSWVFVSNMFYTTMNTNYSFAPPNVRKYFGQYENMNELNVAGISGGFGGSLNFVIFKSLFLNLTLLGGLEPQQRSYRHTDGQISKLGFIGISGDFRSSFGYNGKRFYLMITSLNDVSYMNRPQLNIRNKYVSGAFSFGYRFKVKAPDFYKKFQNTKIYNML